MSVIPDDIIGSEILPRLPPTTILRLKCLNKFYYHYLSSQLFIDNQLRHCHTTTNSPLIVFIALKGKGKGKGKGFRQCLYLLDDADSGRARYLSLPPPFPSDKHRTLKVVGCCNGLLCLNSRGQRSDDTMYYAIIVNPCTGSVLSNISLLFEIEEQTVATCSGLGYDNLSKDYKLVVIEYHFHPIRRFFLPVYRKVSVFSINSNSWTCIETTYHGNFFLTKIWIPTPCTTCALIHTYLMHWLLQSPTNKWSLVCFHLEKQQWAADIPLPDDDDLSDFDLDLDLDLHLGVLNGCLCFSVHNNSDKKKFHLWIMKEYGVPGSWTKFFIDIPGPYDYYAIFAPSQHAPIKEEILLAKSRPDKPGIPTTYVWYNIRDKTTSKELQFSGAPNNLHAPSLCLGSLANCQTHNPQERMKIDDQVKFLQANP